MPPEAETPEEPPFAQWIPLARQVVGTSLRLGWEDAFEIYTYVPTIPLAEALALEARRQGSDTHITLMTDDLWLTSMEELSPEWLREPSPVEAAIHEAITAEVYLGGPSDPRRMRDIPEEKFEANSEGNLRQNEPLRRRRVRRVDLPIGWVTPERAETYGLDYERWSASYRAALAVDLEAIRERGAALARALSGRKAVRITSDAGTDLRFETKDIPPAVDDGIVDEEDVRRGFVETVLPAGRLEGAMRPESAEGEVHATDPLFYGGRTVVRPWFVVEAGRLVEWGAAKRPGLLDRLLKGAKVEEARLGWFSVGLNPSAKPCMLDNRIVENDVGLGLGPHPQLEESADDRPAYFDATTGPVRLDIGP